MCSELPVWPTLNLLLCFVHTIIIFGKLSLLQNSELIKVGNTDIHFKMYYFILSISFPSSIVWILLPFLVSISWNFGGLITRGWTMIRVVVRISLPWNTLIIFRRWRFWKSKIAAKVAAKITFKTLYMFVNSFWDNGWWKAVKFILVLFHKFHFMLFMEYEFYLKTLTLENWIVE